MDAVTILKDLARRPLESVGYVKDRFTPEVLNAHPGGHDNSIAWLLWHSGREIDAQVADLSGEEQVWTVQGFAERFGLGLDPRDHGYGHSAETARSVVVEDADLLLEYLEAAITQQIAYLDTLTDEDLAEIVDENWDPPVTRAARLVSVSEDALQHIGQAAYITGLTTFPEG